MLTELEKIQHLKAKYRTSKRLYTVYQRAGEQGRYTFTLIYGTDSKTKAIRFVHQKELEGLFLIAYCARPGEKSSRCVHVSGMQATATKNPLEVHGVDENTSGQTPVKTPVQGGVHTPVKILVKTPVQGGV